MDEYLKQNVEEKLVTNNILNGIQKYANLNIDCLE